MFVSGALAGRTGRGYSGAMILQTRLPYDPDTARPLPNIGPIAMSEWLLADEAYGAQMAERARLLAERREDVVQLDPGARPAADELLEVVLENLPAGVSRCGETVHRPDGETVTLDRDDPLGTLSRLVQEDLCILEKRPGSDEHVLTGALLCFPASWRLSAKFMHPLVHIHIPVADYDDALARRVQRLFDGIQAGRPLMRFNRLWYQDATLHQPVSRQHRPSAQTESAPFFRSERQCLVRLPRTGAVAFTIHTYVLERETVLGLSA